MRGLVRVLAGTGLLLFSGCEVGPGLNGPATAAAILPGVQVVAAPGYCVDDRARTPKFVVFARCDRLGGESAAGQPLGLITVAAVTGSPSAQDPWLVRVGETAGPGERRGDLELQQVTGTPPLDAVEPTFWRAQGERFGATFGLTFYAGEGTAVDRDQVFDILEAVFANTTAAEPVTQ